MKRQITFLIVVMLFSVASAFAQPVHFQPAQRDMMSNMMMLQANLTIPDSSVRFKCETNEWESKNSNYKYDELWRPTVFETTYADGRRTRVEMTYGTFPTSHPVFSINSITDYSRMLTLKSSDWENGNWVQKSLITSKYDENGFLLAEIEEFTVPPISWEWEGESKADAQNRIIYEKRTRDIPYAITQTWDYVYGANGKVKKATLTTVSSGNSPLILETTYAYNNKDLWIESITHDNSSEKPWEKHILIYDDDGKNIRSEFYEGTDQSSLDCYAYVIQYYPVVGSINETETATILVYPNPTNGELKIDNGELKIENFEIFNIMGQPVMQGKLHDNGEPTCSFTTINIESLPSGMYFLRIGEKVVKFVKE